MNALLLARSLGAALVLPLPGVALRVGLGAGAATFLSTLSPHEAPTLSALAAELGLGVLIGLLVALPLQTAEALGGLEPEALPRAGLALSWGLFGAMGGPALWLKALALSDEALPSGAWLSSSGLQEVGTQLFMSLFLFGFPVWTATLALSPLLGVIERAGRTEAARPLAELSFPASLATLAAGLPLAFHHVTLLIQGWLGG